MIKINKVCPQTLRHKKGLIFPRAPIDFNGLSEPEIGVTVTCNIL